MKYYIRKVEAYNNKNIIEYLMADSDKKSLYLFMDKKWEPLFYSVSILFGPETKEISKREMEKILFIDAL